MGAPLTGKWVVGSARFSFSTLSPVWPRCLGSRTLAHSAVGVALGCDISLHLCLLLEEMGPEGWEGPRGLQAPHWDLHTHTQSGSGKTTKQMTWESCRGARASLGSVAFQPISAFKSCQASAEGEHGQVGWRGPVWGWRVSS